jgi:hypothetical protein
MCAQCSKTTKHDPTIRFPSKASDLFDLLAVHQTWAIRSRSIGNRTLTKSLNLEKLNPQTGFGKCRKRISPLHLR